MSSRHLHHSRRRWLIAATAWLVATLAFAAGWAISLKYTVSYSPPSAAWTVYLEPGGIGLADGSGPHWQPGLAASKQRWVFESQRAVARDTSPVFIINLWKPTPWTELGFNLPGVRTSPRKAVTVPFGLPLAIVLTAFGFCTWRGLRRLPRGSCEACGYDLTGNTSGTCPECGATTASDVLAAPSTNR